MELNLKIKQPLSSYQMSCQNVWTTIASIAKCTLPRARPCPDVVPKYHEAGQMWCSDQGKYTHFYDCFTHLNRLGMALHSDGFNFNQSLYTSVSMTCHIEPCWQISIFLKKSPIISHVQCLWPTMVFKNKKHVVKQAELTWQIDAHLVTC